MLRFFQVLPNLPVSPHLKLLDYFSYLTILVAENIPVLIGRLVRTCAVYASKSDFLYLHCFVVSETVVLSMQNDRYP